MGFRSGAEGCGGADHQTAAGLAVHLGQRRDAKLPFCLCLRLRQHHRDALRWSSPLFAIAAVVAIVVMYDASNVRRAAGEQAKILNYMMDHWMEMKPALFSKELKELLGHTPIQVLAGGLLGTGIGLLGAWLVVGV